MQPCRLLYTSSADSVFRRASMARRAGGAEGARTKLPFWDQLPVGGGGACCAVRAVAESDCPPLRWGALRGGPTRFIVARPLLCHDGCCTGVGVCCGGSGGGGGGGGGGAPVRPSRSLTAHHCAWTLEALNVELFTAELVR